MNRSNESNNQDTPRKTPPLSVATRHESWNGSVNEDPNTSPMVHSRKRSADHLPEQPHVARKGRACLACRKLKVKCDSLERGDSGCSRCQRLGLDCVTSKRMRVSLEDDNEYVALDHKSLSASIRTRSAYVVSLGPHIRQLFVWTGQSKIFFHGLKWRLWKATVLASIAPEKSIEHQKRHRHKTSNNNNNTTTNINNIITINTSTNPLFQQPQQPPSFPLQHKLHGRILSIRMQLMVHTRSTKWHQPQWAHYTK